LIGSLSIGLFSVIVIERYAFPVSAWERSLVSGRRGLDPGDMLTAGLPAYFRNL
jgi:hypothetical protein